MRYRVGQNRNTNFAESECEMVWWFGGRESIFLFSHTNEFCGKDFVALEPRLACAPPKVGRWVCEGHCPRGQRTDSGLPIRPGRSPRKTSG